MLIDLIVQFFLLINFLFNQDSITKNKRKSGRKEIESMTRFSKEKERRKEGRERRKEGKKEEKERKKVGVSCNGYNTRKRQVRKQSYSYRR